MTKLNGIDGVLRVRETHREYDLELWRFMLRGERPLSNLSNAELEARLNVIDRNIQFLDQGSTPRDAVEANRGWLSPWWWLRVRFWTLLEFEHRGLKAFTTDVIPPMPLLAPEFEGVVGGGKKLLVRIGQIEHLKRMLGGQLRFADARSYSNNKLDAARKDDELVKSYKRPGDAITITGATGKIIPAIGDVTFSTARKKGARLVDAPYWFCSFSSDLDPRLFTEFAEDANAGCLVIFDPMAFVRRALPHLMRNVPNTTKQLFPNDYIDPYFPPEDNLSPLVHKDFSYAYQREMRFVLDPEDGPPLTEVGGALFVDSAPIRDIAGVYDRDGLKVDGHGPRSFFASTD